MALIADMAARVLSNLPACPQPIAEDYLRLSAIDFCRSSMAWTEVLDPVSLTAADFPYMASPVTDSKIIKVLSVVVNDLYPSLPETSIRWVEQHVDNWRTALGAPANFIEMPRGVITVIPLPDTDTTLSITVALEPSDSASEIADTLYDEFRSVIVSGALYLLAMIPNMPWTSVPFAMYHKQVFDNGVRDAKRDYNLQFQRMTLTTSPMPI